MKLRTHSKFRMGIFAVTILFAIIGVGGRMIANNFGTLALEGDEIPAYEGDAFNACLVNYYNSWVLKMSTWPDDYTGPYVPTGTVLTTEQLAEIEQINCWATMPIWDESGIVMERAWTKITTQPDFTGLEQMTGLSLDYYGETLDVSSLTKLESLNINADDLGSLDLSHNTKLRHLDVDFAGKKLDVSGLNDLEEIRIESDELTDLVLPNEKTKLKSLTIYAKKLASLDVSEYTNLESLYVSSDEIDTFDVTALTKLEQLGLTLKKLSSIDVSKNTELSGLSFNTSITSIDLSKLEKLWSLTLYFDEMATLDLSRNPELRWVTLQGNYNDETKRLGELGDLKLGTQENLEVLSIGAEMDSLDVSTAPALTNLYVFGGHNNSKGIKALDLSKNTALEYLSVSSVNLQSVQLPESDILKRVNLSDNELETIDLSGLSGLEELEIYNNKLAVLNLSENKKLERLSASYNDFKYLDLKGLENLFSANTDEILLDFADSYSLDADGNIVIDLNGTPYFSYDGIFREGEGYTYDKNTKLLKITDKNKLKDGVINLYGSEYDNYPAAKLVIPTVEYNPDAAKPAGKSGKNTYGGGEDEKDDDEEKKGDDEEKKGGDDEEKKGDGKEDGKKDGGKDGGDKESGDKDDKKGDNKESSGKESSDNNKPSSDKSTNGGVVPKAPNTGKAA